MTARSLHQVATGTVGKVRRTGQPVRRHSYHAGEREYRLWKPFNPRERGPRMAAAEAFNREGKLPGQRNGPLGHIGLEVLRELYRLVCYKTGRLEPSIEYLMRRLRRSRAAVVRALACLRTHGFLDWIRRTEPTDNEGAGPQVRQISNAYGFALPAAALKLVRRLMGKAPQPVDDSERRAQEAAAVEEMIIALPLSEQAQARGVADSSLRDALARLGSAVESSASSPSGQNPASDR